MCVCEEGAFCSCTWGDNNSVQHLTDTFLTSDISLIGNFGGVLLRMEAGCVWALIGDTPSTFTSESQQVVLK